MALKSRPSFWWRASARTRQIIRAILAGPTGILGVFIGIVSVVITVFVYWLTESNPEPIQAVLPGLGIFLFLLACLVGLAWVALHKLPPREFATITIGGQSASRMLQYSSYEIWKVCHGFLDRLEELELDRLIDSPEPDLAGFIEDPTVADRIARLGDVVLEQQSAAMRIFALKHLVAHELGIPVRRLCDFLFQFSPEMHRAQTTKFVRNLQDLVANYETLMDSPTLTSRRGGLLAQNREIVQKLRSIARYQMHMLEFTSLHSHIASLAGEHSTSGSVRNYARALSVVVGEDDRSERLDRMRFLFYKQRAHPGFDLHHTCLGICDSARRLLARRLRERDLEGTEHKRFIRFKRTRRVLARLVDEPKEDPFTDSEEPDEREALRHFSEDVDWLIEDSRKKIVDNFVEFLKDWEDETRARREDTVIVTHGYSKTVREALKRGLGRFVEARQDATGSRDKEVKLPKIYLLDDSEERSFDTRLMTYELKQSNLLSESGAISFGGSDLLLGLLGSRARILVLLGAECFDIRRRVVHARGFKELAKLKEQLSANNRECYVVTLAESYKYHPDVLSVAAFYQDHLDQVFLYEWDLVDRIISNRDMRELWLTKAEMTDLLEEMDALCAEEYELPLLDLLNEDDAAITAQRLRRLGGLMIKTRFAQAEGARSRKHAEPLRRWSWDPDRLETRQAKESPEGAVLGRLRQRLSDRAGTAPMDWKSLTQKLNDGEAVFVATLELLADELGERESRSVAEYLDELEERRIERFEDLGDHLRSHALGSAAGQIIPVPGVIACLGLLGVKYGRAWLADS